VAANGAPLADFSQRLLAYLLDGLIFGLAILVPFFIVFLAIFIPYMSSIDTSTAPDPAIIIGIELVIFAIILPLSFAASYVYYVKMFVKTGQTIGKRVMKIRVVRAVDGGPVDARTARRRWVVQHVAGAVASYFNLADGLWQLWDQPYRQCLHDKCAETVVVQVAQP